jgi:hypothetical protein
MAGCFGNHPEDRSRERQLNEYLESLNGPWQCVLCGDWYDDDDDDGTGHCLKCQEQLKEENQ